MIKKGKLDIHKAWKDKKNEKFDQSKKGFKPSHFRNQQRKLSQAMTKPTRLMGDRPRDPKEIKESLQCWRCGENHTRMNCPLENGYVRKDQNIQGDKIVGQVERTIVR